MWNWYSTLILPQQLSFAGTHHLHCFLCSLLKTLSDFVLRWSLTTACSPPVCLCRAERPSAPTEIWEGGLWIPVVWMDPVIRHPALLTGTAAKRIHTSPLGIWRFWLDNTSVPDPVFIFVLLFLGLKFCLKYHDADSSLLSEQRKTACQRNRFWWSLLENLNGCLLLLKHQGRCRVCLTTCGISVSVWSARLSHTFPSKWAQSVSSCDKQNNQFLNLLQDKSSTGFIVVLFLHSHFLYSVSAVITYKCNILWTCRDTYRANHFRGNGSIIICFSDSRLPPRRNKLMRFCFNENTNECDWTIYWGSFF